MAAAGVFSPSSQASPVSVMGWLLSLGIYEISLVSDIIKYHCDITAKPIG
jgi:hypothetical protein